MLSYANAGHNFPVIIRNGKNPEFCAPSRILSSAESGWCVIRKTMIKLHPGDKLVLYTDGVTEAQSPDGQFFGDDRLLGVLGSGEGSNQKGACRRSAGD